MLNIKDHLLNTCYFYLKTIYKNDAYNSIGIYNNMYITVAAITKHNIIIQQ